MTAVCTASIRSHIEFVKDVLEAISKLTDASGSFNKQELEYSAFVYMCTKCGTNLVTLRRGMLILLH